jgi:hypothetical protein
MKHLTITLLTLLVLSGCSEHEAILWFNTFALTIVIAIGLYGLIYLIDVLIKEAEETDEWYSKELEDSENRINELTSEEEEEGILELERRRKEADKVSRLKSLRSEVAILKKRKGKKKRETIRITAFVLAFMISLFITGV